MIDSIILASIISATAGFITTFLTLIFGDEFISKIFRKKHKIPDIITLKSQILGNICYSFFFIFWDYGSKT